MNERIDHRGSNNGGETRRTIAELRERTMRNVDDDINVVVIGEDVDYRKSDATSSPTSMTTVEWQPSIGELVVRQGAHT